MASILNATTTSGLVTSADNSGSLQLQTNNGTTAVTINTSQNVGVGITSPTARLHVYGGSNNQFKVESSGAEANFTLAGTSYGQINNSVGDWYLTNDASANIIFRTASTERMRIDSSGRVTKPYQPAFMARKSSGNVASGGTIPFGSVTLNIGNHYNASTYTFTAPIAGNYFFTLNVASLNPNSMTAYIVWNGTNFTGGEKGSIGGWEQSTATCILPLAAGDTVFTRMIGTWADVDAGQWTGFAGYLLG